MRYLSSPSMYVCDKQTEIKYFQICIILKSSTSQRRNVQYYATWFASKTKEPTFGWRAAAKIHSQILIFHNGLFHNCVIYINTYHSRFIPKGVGISDIPPRRRRFIKTTYHYQPINVPSAGTQDFLMDDTYGL
jgi:hypothetical protein